MINSTLKIALSLSVKELLKSKHGDNDREEILRIRVCTGFSDISVQRAFKHRYGKETTTNDSILRWYPTTFGAVILKKHING
ncbi:hypothetical protein TNCV_1228011 [Trichonephila clavipes]|nr:hypothetical protein TNCV_1228011 [Trichonephila clavipes]